jgi:hypothetical protein
VRVREGDDLADSTDGNRGIAFMDLLDGTAAVEIIHDGLWEDARALYGRLRVPSPQRPME